MTTMEIGQKMVELCKQGKNLQAIETLFSPEIVSVEAMEMPGMQREMHGIEAVKGKNKWWIENHEWHGGDVVGPFPNGDKFAVIFRMDVTNKMTKERMKAEEIGLYWVKNGKVVREEFFYGA